MTTNEQAFKIIIMAARAREIWFISFIQIQKLIDRARENALKRTTITLSDLEQLAKDMTYLKEIIDDIKY